MDKKIKKKLNQNNNYIINLKKANVIINRRINDLKKFMLFTNNIEIKKEKEKINDDNIFNITEKDIDELVEYINSDIPLKKGKRKKKKNKKNKNYKIEDNIEENKNTFNVIDNRDDVVENFKNSINQYTVENHKKIRPNLSKNWLNKISKFQI